MDAIQAKKLVESSGNSFQCKVANYFRERDWAVLLSPYYVDASSDKPRESDLIVEKLFPVTMYFAGAEAKSVRLRLFVECKYVADGAVFWTDRMDDEQASQLIQSLTPLRRDHSYFREHHYFRGGGQVTKLFASSQSKREDGDPIYRALNQCLHGYIHNRSRDSMVSTLPNEQIKLVDYPVIICSDFQKFYATTIASPAPDPVAVSDNFLVELNYAYLIRTKSNAQLEYFLVDMVDFSKLDAFLQCLQKEMKAATYMLEQH